MTIATRAKKICSKILILVLLVPRIRLRLLRFLIIEVSRIEIDHISLEETYVPVVSSAASVLADNSGSSSFKLVADSRDSVSKILDGYRRIINVTLKSFQDILS